MSRKTMIIIGCLLLVNLGFSDDRIRLTPFSVLDEASGLHTNLREDILLEEGFEGAIVGWGAIDNNNDGSSWAIYEDVNAAHTGIRGAGVFTSGVVSNDYFVFPPIALPADDSIELSFWTRSMDSDYPETFNILVSFSGDDVEDFTLMSTITDVPETWQRYYVDIGFMGGVTAIFAIQNVSDNMYYQFVDDISIIAGGIDPTAPTADFSASPIAGEAPLQVQFTDQSTGDPTSWSWDFGDGGTSTSQNPSHTYSITGTYTVSLTATNSIGSDTFVSSSLISVSNPPPLEDLDLSFWGIRHSAVANQTVTENPQHSYQLSAFDNQITYAYRRGNGAGEVDKTIYSVVSQDRGESWVSHEVQQPNSSTSNYPRSFVTPNVQLVLYQYTDLNGNNRVGIARSTNQGINFDPDSLDNSGLANIINTHSNSYPAYDQSITPSGKIYLANKDGLYSTLDGGDTFSERSIPQTHPNRTYFKIAADDQYLWFCYLYDDSIFVHKSDDNGSSYQNIGQFLVDQTNSSNNFSISAQNGQLAMLWTEIITTEHILKFRLIDQNDIGDEIEIKNNGSTLSFGEVNLYQTNSYLWASTHNNVFIYRSSDNGNTWGQPAYMTTQMSGSSFDFVNASFVDDVTLYLLNSTYTSGLYNHKLYNLRWTDFPYSTDFLDSVFTGDVLSVDWNSYISTSHYRFQFSADGFVSNLKDTILTSSSIDLSLTDFDLLGGVDYSYRIRGQNGVDEGDYFTSWTPEIVLRYGAVGVSEDVGILPISFQVHQNYPNPFNPSTTIRYGLPETSNVSIIIYDVRGKVLQTLDSEQKSAGWYDVVWNGQTADGKTISTGIYFARLVAGDYSQVIKMLYLK